MATESRASTVWQGNLTEGSGTTTPASGAFPEVEVSWASRTERAAGKTSPEELLAAAHASCYCMALSHELDQAGNAPERLEASASVEFVPGEGVMGSHIVVKGTVPGMDQAQFEEFAKSAGQNCPISGALDIPISVEATLS